MALRTFVKINSVNNLSDARYSAGMNVDLIGFNLNTSSSDYISPETFKEITTWTSGLEFVGEFNDCSVEMIKDSIDKYEMHYLESNEASTLLAINTDVKKILNISIDKLSSLVELDGIDYLLISGADTFREIDISSIKKHADKFKILLGSGFGAQNVDNLLEQTGAFGIALSGSDEIRPGYKDYDELADILEALEVDEWA